MVSAFVIVAYFANKYYLSEYQLNRKRKEMKTLIEHIESNDVEELIKDINNIEKYLFVKVIYESFDNIKNSNQSIKDKLYEKELYINIDILDEYLSKVKVDEIDSEIYEYRGLRTFTLITSVKKEDIVFIVISLWSYSNETLITMYELNYWLLIFGIIILVTLIWISIKRIIAPLEKLKVLSGEIANLNFKKIDIKTGDEIQDLGDSINSMSEELQKAHDEFKNRNENLKTFIADISHEVKTPLALIKAYSRGIDDGFDDGTYPSVIVEQVDNISTLIDRLLKLSKIDRDSINNSIFNVEELFYMVFEKYKIILENKNIIYSIDNDRLEDGYISADKEKIEIVLNNLISNAVKYTASNLIEIKLENLDENLIFSIKNGISNYDEKTKNKIWEPFYVIESSRNKELSGTGLGLSIVKIILEKHNIKYGAKINNNTIELYIYFQKSPIK